MGLGLVPTLHLSIRNTGPTKTPSGAEALNILFNWTETRHLLSNWAEAHYLQSKVPKLTIGAEV